MDDSSKLCRAATGQKAVPEGLEAKEDPEARLAEEVLPEAADHQEEQEH